MAAPPFLSCRSVRFRLLPRLSASFRGRGSSIGEPILFICRRSASGSFWRNTVRSLPTVNIQTAQQAPPILTGSLITMPRKQGISLRNCKKEHRATGRSFSRGCGSIPTRTAFSFWEFDRKTAAEKFSAAVFIFPGGRTFLSPTHKGRCRYDGWRRGSRGGRPPSPFPLASPGSRGPSAPLR